MLMRRVVRYIRLCVVLAIVCGAMSGCSTKKNTGVTRFFHAMTAKYNIMYNGEVAFKEGMDAQTDAHKDDFTRLLPMYISTNKATAGVGRTNYETAVTKSEKAIKLHSIKKRPTVNPSKKRNDKLKAYLQRKEFNPVLWRAWLMMGVSQFQMGEFIEAASTFSYMARVYQKQPAICSLAQSWLAKCYVALDWPYDAEDVLRKMARDSIGPRATNSYHSARTAWLIQTGQYEEAVPVLQTVIDKQRGSIQRARLNFLMGQLCRQTGRKDMALRALRRVVKSNPPYEMALSARILMSEMADRSNAQGMIKRLTRMAKSQNNSDYQDQIYMAIGNIHLAMPDTMRCIYAWEKGVKESTRDGAAKTQLLLRLATLYWEQRNYIDAARCYAECVKGLDKQRDDYNLIKNRSDILSELNPHLKEIKLQDSLQVLASLSEKEQMEVAERLVKEYKKKEKEEARLNENKQMSAQRQEADKAAAQQMNKPASQSGSNGKGAGLWYFYNPQTVSKGREIFVGKWGNRPNVDNWRWASVLVAEMQRMGEETGNDSVPNMFGNPDFEIADSDEQARLDSLANDPHTPEFYLSQIPNTPEQMDESHALLSKALFEAGKLEKDRLGDYAMSRSTLERLVRDYPDFEQMDETLYYLFLIYSREGEDTLAQSVRDRITADYAESSLARLLANPKYEMIARGGRHLEDSVYAETYLAYKKSEYEVVDENYRFSTDNYPEGRHRSRFMFVQAMSRLYSGDKESFLAILKELIDNYSKEEISRLAAEIMKGVNEGRLLRGSHWETSGIWSRASRTRMEGDSIVADTLTHERLDKFAFVLAYPKGAVDEDQLLFEVARFNFTSFMVRNFELEFADNGDISMLVVKGFVSYDEVHSYAQRLYSDRHMSVVLEGMRTVLISESNLRLLGTEYSFDEYKDYFDTHFAPIKVQGDAIIDDLTPDQLNSEDDIDEDEADDAATEETDEEESAPDYYDDFPFGF